MEKDCGELGILFMETIADIKASFSVWEEFTSKTAKLNSAMKMTIAASISFQEAFVKLAEMANGTRGANKDIGIVLMKLCARHQAMEIKLKAYAMSLIDLLIAPIQKSLDDWQKTVVQLDKDHSRDYKRAHNELKKASGETIRLQKKLNKGKTDIRTQLDEASRDANTKFVLLEDLEKRFATSALLEERNHLRLLASCLKPVLDNEISMLSEFHHLQDIADTLGLLASDGGGSLPAAVEQVLFDASRMNSSSVESKRKLSKEDPYIEVVVGSLKSSGDSIQMPLMDLPSHDAADPLLAKLGSPEGILTQGQSIQSSGLMHQRMAMQRIETGVCASDPHHRINPYESCQSLQCSSGYGTMTNVSISSNEAGGAYDESFQSYDLSRGERFCTLPNRRPFSARQVDPYRPSFAAVQDMFVKHDQDALRMTDGSYDPYQYGNLSDIQPGLHQQPYSEPVRAPRVPFQRQVSYTGSDDDDLPLPPPPEELISSPEHRFGGPVCPANAYRKQSATLPRNMLAMQNFPNALASGHNTRRESECSQTSSWSDRSSGLSSSLEVEENSECNFARQLKSVKLKRAVSYDRSSPRVQK